VAPEAREYLKIDSETGEIHLIKSIDFEQRQRWLNFEKLRIRAKLNKFEEIVISHQNINTIIIVQK